MCRWITLLSSRPVSLNDLILSPSNSLVQMSIDASYHPGYGEMNNHVMNGDGFGVGWYHTNRYINKTPPVLPPPGVPSPPSTMVSGDDDDENEDHPRTAAVFKDVLPAWNNINLREICQATYSDCVIAHVRAASKGSGVSQQNCHPFKAGRLLFCHNGRIDQFPYFRRQYLSLLSEECYMSIRGTTDSEFIFALLLTILARDGQGKVHPMVQTKPFGHGRLVAAIKEALILIEKVQKDAGFIDGFNTCNFSLTDGDTMVVSRYCDKSPEIPAPSLYYAFGNSEQLYKEITQEEEVITMHSSHPSTTSLSTFDDEKKSESDSNSDTDKSRHNHVKLSMSISSPGQIFANVDVNNACLVVCSIPLTHTHKWHRLPRNSILYFTRGTFPELTLIGRTSARLTTE